MKTIYRQLIWYMIQFMYTKFYISSCGSFNKNMDKKSMKHLKLLIKMIKQRNEVKKMDIRFDKMHEQDIEMLVPIMKRAFKINEAGGNSYETYLSYRGNSIY